MCQQWSEGSGGMGPSNQLSIDHGIFVLSAVFLEIDDNSWQR